MVVGAASASERQSVVLRRFAVDIPANGEAITSATCNGSMARCSGRRIPAVQECVPGPAHRSAISARLHDHRFAKIPSTTTTSNVIFTPNTGMLFCIAGQVN
jgi:hypothetical protein